MAARKKSEEPSINIDEVLTDEELKAVANESEPAERKAKPEDGPRTVVVAEDEAVNRMDLVAMLEDNGYEVVGQAANGEEAVELTRKYRPDVVCMDVKMPRMDGITAAGIICDENIAPVVMLTAFSQTDLVKKATGAGAISFSHVACRSFMLYSGSPCGCCNTSAISCDSCCRRYWFSMSTVSELRNSWRSF